MAVVEKRKKQMSFNKILIIFGGSFVVFILFGIIVASLLSGNSSKKQVSRSNEPIQQNTQSQIGTSQGQLPTNPNTAIQQQPVGQNDIATYMATQDEMRGQESISKQMQALSSQMQALNGEFNKGNNNLMLQIQKMNSDLILLDQRITNLENALKPQNQQFQQMSGKKYNKSSEDTQKVKGKVVNQNLIQAATNNRIWITGSQTKSFAVGEKVGKHKLIYVDDVHQKVYMN